jgi:hypothetical protein
MSTSGARRARRTAAPDGQGVCAFVSADHRSGPPARVFGMGILVTRTEVVTCAHVIETVLGGAPGAGAEAVVRIWFPHATATASIAGTVDPARWYPAATTGMVRDIALVRLERPAPKDVAPASLRPYRSGATIRAFGYRSRRDGPDIVTSAGEWASGVVAGTAVGGRVQGDRLSLTGVGVEPGFSGAGVYDDARRAVVGMMTEADAEPSRNYFFFIAAETIQEALRLPAPLSAAAARPIAADRVAAVRERLSALEDQLQRASAAVPAARAGQKTVGYLRALLRDATDTASLVRAGFGLPIAADAATEVADVLALDEPSTQPIINLLAQRLYHVLWRVEVSLRPIEAPWTRTAVAKVRRLAALLQPDVLAQSPTLAHLRSALESGSDLAVFAEPGPDPVLYAVLRALGDAAEAQSVLTGRALEDARQLALDHLHATVERVLQGSQVVDDVSNVWWAARIGICRGDPRFRALLPDLADRLAVAPAPPAALRGTAVREIFTADRAQAYTLSNIQAIVEAAPDLDDALLVQLHVLVEDLCQRLLDTPPPEHFYLAAVHFEGLRNYLDYVAQIERG